MKICKFFVYFGKKKLFSMKKYRNIFVPGYTVECGILVYVGPVKSVQKQRRHDVGAFHMRTWLGPHYAKRNETNLEISLILNAYFVHRKGNDSTFLFLVLKIIWGTNIHTKAAKYYPNIFFSLSSSTRKNLPLEFKMSITDLFIIPSVLRFQNAIFLFTYSSLPNHPILRYWFLYGKTVNTRITCIISSCQNIAWRTKRKGGKE